MYLIIEDVDNVLITREELGQVVRQAWTDYVLETGTESEHNTLPWEDLDDWAKEVDRRIGVAVVKALFERKQESLKDFIQRNLW